MNEASREADLEKLKRRYEKTLDARGALYAVSEMPWTSAHKIIVGLGRLLRYEVSNQLLEVAIKSHDSLHHEDKQRLLQHPQSNHLEPVEAAAVILQAPLPTHPGEVMRSDYL